MIEFIQIAAAFALGCGIGNYLYRVPKELKRIADALEKRK